MLLTFVSIPNATDTLESVGEWSSPLITELLPIAFVFIGCLVGGLILLWIMESFINAISRLFHKDEF